VTRKPRGASWASSALRVLSVWGLLLLIVVLIVVFSLLKPDTFPTFFNFQSILSNKSIQMLLALAVMIPMAANNFDLSVGYVVGIAQVLAIGLQVNQNVSWPVAAAAILLLGAGVGLINGLLVTRAHIDSFIATLGTGTVLYGLDEWYTGGTQVTGTLQPGFSNLAATIGGAHGIPAPAIYVVLVSLALWAVFDYLPLGRYIYVLGANPRAAELNGISAGRYITIAFIAGGTLAAFAGVILEAELRVGQSSVGPEYLLPSFTGALLGATSVKAGARERLGLAVGVLSITVAGLQQLGAPFFVEQIFNGTMLVVAVGLAVYATRRRAGSRPEMPAAAGTGSSPAAAAVK
jgi:ribose transport system permease protein